MTYDPFARGPYPVGVRSAELTDNERDGRSVPIELWYPASPRHRGEDVAEATQDLYAVFGAHQVRQDAVRDAEAAQGARSLVVFSHGMAGHRRQSTFFCTHLASHGFLVISPDHGGSTLSDLLALALRVKPDSVPRDIKQLLGSYVTDRPRDVDFLIETAFSGALPLPCPLLSEVGVAGHSFGGFTALAVASRNERVHAVVALAPAGGAGPLSMPGLRRELTFAFAGRVATLYLAAERDTLLPLAGVEELFQLTPEPARMFVLPDSDHMHFCDRAESSHEFLRGIPKFGIFSEIAKSLPPFSELVPAAHGYSFAQALGLAHFDAVLRQNDEAKALLASDVVALCGARGIAIRASAKRASAP